MTHKNSKLHHKDLSKTKTIMSFTLKFYLSFQKYLRENTGRKIIISHLGYQGCDCRKSGTWLLDSWHVKMTDTNADIIISITIIIKIYEAFVLCIYCLYEFKSDLKHRD